MGHNTITVWECDLCGEEVAVKHSGQPPHWMGFAWFKTPQDASQKHRFAVCPPCGIGLRYLLGAPGLSDQESSDGYTTPNRSHLQDAFLRALDPVAYADAAEGPDDLEPTA